MKIHVTECEDPATNYNCDGVIGAKLKQMKSKVYARHHCQTQAVPRIVFVGRMSSVLAS